MKRLRLALLPLAGFLLGLAVAGPGTSGHAGPPADHHTITMRFSGFTPGVVTVPAGVPVTFELRNEDPIEHEWIVGTEDVHRRHRSGTEPYHDEIPTEVTLRPYETRVTTVTFDAPGEYAFVCHLPGHEAYGMRGAVKVVR